MPNHALLRHPRTIVAHGEKMQQPACFPSSNFRKLQRKRYRPRYEEKPPYLSLLENIAEHKTVQLWVRIKQRSDKIYIEIPNTKRRRIRFVEYSTVHKKP